MKSKYGRLTVISKLPGPGRRVAVSCDCGSFFEAKMYNLERGFTRSCGCLKAEVARERTKERNTTHGMTGTPEYVAWKHMKGRCLNENSKDYRLYGGRGIRVCSEWVRSFPAFYRDMGPRPGPEFSVERRDSNADYTPSNCYWGTPDQQANNTSRNKVLELDGEKMTMAQAARRYGIPYSTLRTRLGQGMDARAAISMGVRQCSAGVLYELDGEEKTLTEWAESRGMGLTTLVYRLKAGKSLADALSTPVKEIARCPKGIKLNRRP